jgi:hypothetical protein
MRKTILFYLAFLAFGSISQAITVKTTEIEERADLTSAAKKDSCAEKIVRTAKAEAIKSYSTFQLIYEGTWQFSPTLYRVNFKEFNCSIRADVTIDQQCKILNISVDHETGGDADPCSL